MTMAAEELVEEERFETSHTTCAVFLVYCGFEAEVQWDGSTCYFFFENTPELQAEVLKFVSGQARVEPQQYSNTFGQITRRMREHPTKPTRR